MPFAKKSRGDDNEPRGAVAADMSVEEKIEVEKDVDVDTQSTKLSLQLPDTNEVGECKEPILSYVEKMVIFQISGNFSHYLIT